jgi:hypothetical protein
MAATDMDVTMEELLGGGVLGRDPQGAWPQDELIGGKPPVVK